MSVMRFSVAAVLLFACAPFALAQAEIPLEQQIDQVEQAVPLETPKPRLVLRELVVIQADRYDKTANNARLLPTSLPAAIFKTGREKGKTDDQQYHFGPMPLGFVTFEGVIDEPMTLRLELPSSASKFQAFFPKEDAIVGEQQLGWKAIQQAGDQQQAVSFAGQGDWLEALRESDDRLWLRSRDERHKERFLLYDASLKFSPAIEVGITGEQYHLKAKAPEQADPPLCLLVRKTDAGWHTDQLAAPWSSPKPTIAPKTADSPADIFKQVLAPIKDLLEQRGYNAQEIKLALSMIESAGFDKSRFSLVYIMPAAVLDEYIQLRVKPVPDQVIRTAIVVVNNVDPDLGSQVNALLDDLGSDDWLKRDRAQRELIGLGQAAIKKVQQIKNHKDPEVAFRAQQILEAYDWKMSGGK